MTDFCSLHAKPYNTWTKNERRSRYSRLADIIEQHTLGSVGTADPLVDALIYRYEGALYAELGRYDEAEHARNNALIEYTHAGDEHPQGRTPRLWQRFLCSRWLCARRA